MPIKRRGRVSLRDTLLKNQAASKMYATMAGKELAPQVVAIPDAPKKRVKSNEPRKHLLEKDVQKAILQLLKKHPKIKWVARFNSGTFQDGDRYVTSNSQRGMSDIMGMLSGGRLLAIEVKSETGRVQPHQQEFIDLINAGGGLAFVARSVEDVLKEL